MILTLELTDAEAEALLEAVTFDAGTSEDYGGHPASEALLAKLRAALGDA